MARLARDLRALSQRARHQPEEDARDPRGPRDRRGSPPHEGRRGPAVPLQRRPRRRGGREPARLLRLPGRAAHLRAPPPRAVRRGRDAASSRTSTRARSTRRRSAATCARSRCASSASARRSPTRRSPSSIVAPSSPTTTCRAISWRRSARTSLADALIREPSQFLRTLDFIQDPDDYGRELATLEAAMAVLARRAEAGALLAAIQRARASREGRRQARSSREPRAAHDEVDDRQAAPRCRSRTRCSSGPCTSASRRGSCSSSPGSAGAHALYIAREALTDASARPQWVTDRSARRAPRAGVSSRTVLPRLEVHNDTRHRLRRGPPARDARAPGPGARRRGREVPRASAAAPDRARGDRSALGRARAQAAHGRARVRRGAGAHRRRHGAAPDPRDRRGDAQRDRAAAHDEGQRQRRAARRLGGGARGRRASRCAPARSRSSARASRASEASSRCSAATAAARRASS